MKKQITNKNGYIFTIYTAETPYKVCENGVSYFKQLITWDNSRIGRVIYERKVIIN